ncbi:hypothetical protein FT663_05238 [Candidozyma haemuli var. vulneris]|uniref:Oxysterol-binding protein n=1 Tax=Candidozyma haemuli TaxID=45357 RepID=A0A2V1AZ62_9ASCO|nr:hypothetical protein CXQ85_003094 [[Candida] haemuloni]KAF3985583.1 hypothetical protein FT663_05238 [[Candida] haemuloni var. vulneris]KAF3988515.1 hypothetical protein FT662_03384 [[Candida] haemuloni var. vulneris]PVH23360.1 hypothetical protein CXQ85_003094 [[Candida] haemuloni]
MVLHRLKNKIGGSDSSSAPEEGDDIGSENQSILMGIISQLRPGCDLTRITLPTFILERRSMLERITNAFHTPQILFEANSTSNDVERFLLIVKWYLSGWHIAPKAVKKPLNPVLGEVFSCFWDDLPDQSTGYYVAEQTCHHPPESSYFYMVPEKKIRADGVVIPRSKFLGNSSAAMMEGVARLTLGEHDDEVYTMNQPNVYCRGILFGKLKMELGDHMVIRCEKLGLEADIEFKTKGFISGDYDVIEGTVKDLKSSKTLYTITGKWNGSMEIQEGKGAKELFLDTKQTQTYPLQVKPMDEQLPHESRKLWDSTIKALGENDHRTATDEKFKIEEEQRVKARERAETGEQFEPKIFRKVDGEIPFIVNCSVDVSNDSPEEMKFKLNELFRIVPQDRA